MNKYLEFIIAYFFFVCASYLSRRVSLAPSVQARAGTRTVTKVTVSPYLSYAFGACVTVGDTVTLVTVLLSVKET